MFKDSPIIGVGSGNYQLSLVTSYLYLLPTWARTTLSHTSLVSLMAELGIVGLSVFLFVCVRVAATVIRVYRNAGGPYVRLIAGWLGASFLAIVLQSQSEGRLLDEPYLWLLLAILIAVETQPGFRRSAVAAPAQEDVVQPQAIGVASSPPRPAPPRTAPEPVPGAG
jgi:O-antigen ligase